MKWICEKQILMKLWRFIYWLLMLKKVGINLPIIFRMTCYLVRPPRSQTNKMKKKYIKYLLFMNICLSSVEERTFFLVTLSTIQRSSKTHNKAFNARYSLENFEFNTKFLFFHHFYYGSINAYVQTDVYMRTYCRRHRTILVIIIESTECRFTHFNILSSCFFLLLLLTMTFRCQNWCMVRMNMYEATLYSGHYPLPRLTCFINNKHL